MTTEEYRKLKLHTMFEATKKAQRELRRVEITFNGERKIIDPIILFNYEGNEEYEFSPFVMEMGTIGVYYSFDLLDSLNVTDYQIDPNHNRNFTIEMFTDEELLKSMSQNVSNLVVAGRVKFPKKH